MVGGGGGGGGVVDKGGGGGGGGDEVEEVLDLVVVVGGGGGGGVVDVGAMVVEADVVDGGAEDVVELSCRLNRRKVDATQPVGSLSTSRASCWCRPGRES